MVFFGEIGKIIYRVKLGEKNPRIHPGYHYRDFLLTNGKFLGIKTTLSKWIWILSKSPLNDTESRLSLEPIKSSGLVVQSFGTYLILSDRLS